MTRTATRAPSSRASRSALASALLVGVGSYLALGCSCEETGKPEVEAPVEPSVPAPRPNKGSEPTELSLLDLSARCTLHQAGMVLDMGAPAVEARRLFRLTKEAPPERTQRAGEPFRRFDQMSTDFVFWLTDELKEFEFTARVHGLGSERIAAYVNGKRLGSAALKTDETHTVRISGRDLELAPGRHKLTIALSRPRGGNPEADISWARLGPRDGEPVVPATRKETFSEVTIEGERQAAVVLRPSSSLRCPVWIPPKTTFLTDVGIWGEGSAETEIVVHTKDGERVVVAAEERKEDDPRKFTTLQVDLSRFASQFVDLEIAAPRALKRARIAAGDPRLRSVAPPSESAPRAKRAIVILLSGLSHKHAPPAAAEHGAPFMNQLAAEAAHYPNYRASTTSIPGVVASLVSGLPPWAHGVEKETDKLAPDLLTVAGLVEAEGGRSAFFTGVPLSFEPFGFARGFEKFESIGPQEDRAAVEPIALAKKWLGSRLDHQGPVVSFIHLRGGHPPFDVSKEAAVDLAPEEYGGDLTPRRAAIQLAEIRGRRSVRHRRMPSEDWTRMFALQKAALLKQSSELSHLIDWLRKKDAYADTLIVVMGDVGAGEQPLIPFSTKASLHESILGTPLLIKFPRGHLGGSRPRGLFAPRDVTATILRTLGIQPDASFDGIDLGAASAEGSAELRPHMAYRGGAYAMRLGSYLLVGEDGSAPRLCHLALDPTCQEDRSEQQVLESRALWYAAWNMLSPALSQPAKVPKQKGPLDEEPEEDSFFDNALTVWGVDR